MLQLFDGGYGMKIHKLARICLLLAAGIIGCMNLQVQGAQQSSQKHQPSSTVATFYSSNETIFVAAFGTEITMKTSDKTKNIHLKSTHPELWNRVNNSFAPKRWWIEINGLHLLIDKEGGHLRSGPGTSGQLR